MNVKVIVVVSLSHHMLRIYVSSQIINKTGNYQLDIQQHACYAHAHTVVFSGGM